MTEGTPYHETDRAFEAWIEEQERLCGATAVTGGHDPSGTDCMLERGHRGPHIGPEPITGEGIVKWTGGGMCAGDPLPIRWVR